MALLLRAELKMNVMNRKGSGGKLILHKLFCLEMRCNTTGKFFSVDKALL